MSTVCFPALSAEDLIQAGQALYGARWRVELALALGLEDEMQIRAVESGRIEAPPEWREQLVAIAQDIALRAMDTAGALLWRERAPREEGAPRLPAAQPA